MIVDIYYDLTHALLQPRFIVILLDYQLNEWFLHIDVRIDVILVLVACVVVLKVSLDCLILPTLIIFCFLDLLFFFLHSAILTLCL